MSTSAVFLVHRHYERRDKPCFSYLSLIIADVGYIIASLDCRTLVNLSSSSDASMPSLAAS